MEPLLTASGVLRDFRIEGRTLPVLKGVDVEVLPGEILAIVGKSGAGKSTLLHILGALDVPTAGRVVYKGSDLATMRARDRARLRNRSFGFMFQFYHLFPEFNALENVLIPSMVGMSVFGWFAERTKSLGRAQELLSAVGLAERARHRPAQLSGGERQRVAIARAMMNSPEILFCDEPTGNLDSKTGAEISAMLWNLNRQKGQTIVIVTHDEALAREAGRMIVMLDGKIIDVRKGKGA